VMVRVEGSKSEAAKKRRQGKCSLLTSLFIDDFSLRSLTSPFQA
jgi:hypothetical protein